MSSENIRDALTASTGIAEAEAIGNDVKVNALPEDTVEKLEHRKFFDGSFGMTVDGRGYAAVRAASFGTVEEMLAFFDRQNGEGRGYLIVGTPPVLNGRLVVFFTSVVDDETMELIQAHGEAVAQLREKIREEVRTREAAAEEMRQKIEEEQQRLRSLGERCEHNHGAVIEENSKLKAELKKLRKQ